jgi:Cu/Ag efflux protein CusF
MLPQPRAHDSTAPLSTAGGFVLAFFVLSTVPAAATSYWSAIHAVVLSVDRSHKTVTIRSEALETLPAGVRTCSVRDARALQELHTGELIEARAQTSVSKWNLEDIRVVHNGGVGRPDGTHIAWEAR